MAPMGANWKKLADIGPGQVTPMLRQFMEAKGECPDSLLFFRMGDFYELFFEDAVEASELLGLTLTSRDSTDSDSRIPMAGVPVRALDGYLARLIKAGRTVTICEQVEDPKAAKGIVRREIVRTVTPGTVIEPDLLEETANNYLAALLLDAENVGLAFVDISTGEFLAAQINDNSERTLHDELIRMGPVEVLVPETLNGEHLEQLRTRFDGVPFTARPVDDFDADLAGDRLSDRFGLSTLKGVALDDAPQALGCVGAVLAYVTTTQRDTAPQLRLPRRYSPSGYVVLDGATQRNLELVESLADKRKHGSLLGVLDKTRTSMGGRKLRQWILHPLLDVKAIRDRLGAVEELFFDSERRLNLHEALRYVADLERLLGRITSKSGNARDVKALGRSLEQAPAVRAALVGAEADLVVVVRDGMDDLADVASWIDREIIEEPPPTLMEGNLLNDGFHEELDRLRGLVRGGRDWIAALKRDESERTGIPNLKVGYNKVFGYYIEVTKSYVGQVPDEYERKQTLVNAERYITPALKEREEEIVSAQDRLNKLEYDLFVELRERVAAEAARIQETADAIAVIDVLLSLADVASTKGYCKPQIDDTDEIHIRDGRHPVVEDLMARNEFVPNDSAMDPATAAIQIITGPNMAGKSTYLRQVAVITLMAQVGSFVPANDARIGVVDRIFTRVGASDNLVRGESTFMVEMIETANILNTATNRSLLVLDEIGRGTSTFDGISIAWSVAEHIHEHIGAKTLFATHYHELTELANQLPRAKNLNVAVREWGGKVIFLYRIAEGGADHSYGIQVAKLAGLPRAIIKRAHEVLELLESGNTAALGLPEQLNLFGPAKTESTPSAIEAELDAVVADELTPRQAQDFLYHLKEMLKKRD
jgi:DNA mismatch repair protein MutS